MENFKIIHNVETKEIEVIELSADEIEKQIEDDLIANQRMKQQEENKIKRQELLQKLGITEDEAKLLLS